MTKKTIQQEKKPQETKCHSKKLPQLKDATTKNCHNKKRCHYKKDCTIKQDGTIKKDGTIEEMAQ